MESATINAFKNATNANKNHFSGWFVGIWGQYSNPSEIDEQVTMRSLKKLRDDLNFIRQEYKDCLLYTSRCRKIPERIKHQRT